MSKKHTREIARAKFLGKNLELLEEEYKNNKTPMRYRCLKKGCNYEGKKSLHNLLSGCGCPKCSEKKKYTKKEVISFFSARNLELLEKEYKNNSTPMKYRCKIDGYLGKIRLNDLLSGKGCCKCGHKKATEKTRKYNTKEIKEKFLEKNLEWLEKEYKNNRTKMKYRCKIDGYLGEIRLTDLLRGQGCWKCGCQKRTKYTEKIAKNLFLEKNLLLLGKYINSSIPVKYKCLICDYRGQKWLGDLLRGSGCKQCGYKKLSKALEGRICSEETRKKISKKLKGRKFSKEHRKNLSNAKKGKKHYFYGKHHSEETRKKIGLRHKNKIISKETREKLRKINLGKKLSEETKRKISKKLKGRIFSEEHKKKIGLFNKGKIFTEKTRKKLSKSRKGKYSGKDNHMWNPNLTDEDRSDRRYIPEYKEWKFEVKERDNFTCKRCKDDKGGNLVSHHILNYSTNKNLRFEISNGITLCENCHKLFHSKKRYGQYNNTREQLKEFLTEDLKNKK